MKSWVKRALRILPAVAASITLLGLPSIALAQGQMPSYAVGKGETIKGTISSFNGAYTMYVRDARGYIDNVTLHQGTIINPTGIRLQPGYPVTIYGRTSGSTFLADQIDTPYRIVYGYGYPGYYGYPYYPYPAYSIGLGFGWGWGGGWGRGWHR
ncbi:MAG TPA: hypothetical protein VMG98_01945 [Verrucomicrobiae bacterium]|nr:hypothetical protein [Verrucomicrobiae bacterium]